MDLQSAQDLRDELVQELSAAHSVVAYAAQARQYPRIWDSSAERLLKHATFASPVGAIGDLYAAAFAGVSDVLDAFVGLPALNFAQYVRLAKPAIGIAAADKGFRIAVRISQEQLSSSPLVQRITEISSGEVDIRVTGAIRAHIEWGPLEWLLGRKPRGPYQISKRPLQIGWSVGHPHTTAGTIGAFVHVDDDSGVHLLSCNHVLADCNRGKIGDSILQPGRLDRGKEPNDVIGSLSHVRRLTRSDPNLFDIALCRLSENMSCQPRRLGDSAELAGVASDPTAEVNKEVQKLGRTTGHTWGHISAFGLLIPEVLLPNGSSVAFDQQFEIEGRNGPFSDPGDSGALVYNEDNVGVGILNSGDEWGYGFASPLNTVFGSMKLRLAG
jgi:hypothetical protein